jgi:hypothetical protein
MANDLAIHALTMGGYNAQWLKVILKKKEVEESICVPNTAARWEQLAVALGHSGQFHASIDMNITNNNILILFKMKYWVAARATAKKDKKPWQQQQTNKEKAHKILCEEEKKSQIIFGEGLRCVVGVAPSQKSATQD